MNYFYWYIGLGVALTICLFAVAIFSKNTDSSSADNYVERMGFKHFLSLESYKKLLSNIFGCLVIVTLWPVLAILMITDLFDRKSQSKYKTNHPFEVKKESLLERLTQVEVESRERIQDPLNAVPNLPFGHLYQAWCKFLEKKSLDSEIWSFEAEWKNDFGDKELRIGYALVDHEGVPYDYFLVMAKVAMPIDKLPNN